MAEQTEVTLTQEIEKALKELTTDTLKQTIRSIKGNESGEREDLIKTYQTHVIEVGLRNFVKKLKEEDVRSTITSLGKELGTNDKDKEVSIFCKKLTDHH